MTPMNRCFIQSSAEQTVQNEQHGVKNKVNQQTDRQTDCSGDSPEHKKESKQDIYISELRDPLCVNCTFICSATDFWSESVEHLHLLTDGSQSLSADTNSRVIKKAAST